MDGQNFQNDQNQYNNQNQYSNQDPYNNPYYSQPVAAQPVNKTPALAIVSLVMGILSIVLGCCYGIGIIFAVAGIVMAVIANKGQKSGVGIAGLVCSIVGAVFSVIMIVYFAAVINVLINDPDFMHMLENYY